MGVLSKVEIVRRLGLPPEDFGAIVITPIRRDPNTQEPLGIDRDSIDLRLGARFLLPRAHRLEVLAFSESDPGKYYKAVEAVHIPPGGKIVVPAHGTILGATLEYIKLPFDVSGQVLTRSSLARRFISIATAPWIHPLYRGCLTLEIANASSTPITLCPGDAIGQLVLFTVENAAPPDNDEIEDVYFGPVFPELPIA